MSVDTLYYFHETLIEYSEKQTDVNKLEIEYSSWGKITKITINKTGKINYISYFSKPILGTNYIYKSHKTVYTKQIDTIKFDTLWTVVNHINWDKYKNEYEVNCIQDATGAEINISFNTGTKKIVDYPLCGTLGLMYIYNWIEENEIIKY